MKTQLPDHITTPEEAVKFLTELHDNREAFHPEDDAAGYVDIETGAPYFTATEAERLNKLTKDIYAIPAFDPCFILINLMARDAQ